MPAHAHQALWAADEHFFAPQFQSPTPKDWEKERAIHSLLLFQQILSEATSKDEELTRIPSPKRGHAPKGSKDVVSEKGIVRLATTPQAALCGLGNVGGCCEALITVKFSKLQWHGVTANDIQYNSMPLNEIECHAIGWNEIE